MHPLLFFLQALTYNTVLLNKDIQENDVTPGDPPIVVPRNTSQNVNRLERRGKIIEGLLSSGADLICLQEVCTILIHNRAKDIYIKSKFDEYSLTVPNYRVDLILTSPYFLIFNIRTT